MSAILSRLVLAMALFAATPVVYTLIYQVIEHGWIRRDETALLVTNVITAILFGLTWVGIWRKEVTWSDQRILRTALSIPASILPAYGVYLVMISLEPYLDEPAVILGGICWAVTWLASTAIIWRDTKEERAGRLRGWGVEVIACPTCSYNLTGLREARCPECGTAYTLDQLIGAQLRNRTEAQLGDTDNQPES